MNTAIGGHSSQEENESAFLAGISRARRRPTPPASTWRSRSTATSWPPGRSPCRCWSGSGTRASRSRTTPRTASSTATRRPSTTCTRCCPYLANVHLKDKRGGKGVWDFPEPGAGHVDFTGILKVLDDAGYDGPASVEIEFDGTWPDLAGIDAVMKAGATTSWPAATTAAEPPMIGIAILGAGFMGQTHAGPGRRSTAGCGSRWSRRAPPSGPRRSPRRAEQATSLRPAGGDRRSRVDLVDICLPTPLHRATAEAAFAAGKHVLLEKPLALTREDGEAILTAAPSAPAGRCCVGLVLRHWPEYQRLHELAADRRDRHRPHGVGARACRRPPTGPTGSSTRASPAASRST